MAQFKPGSAKPAKVDVPSSWLYLESFLVELGAKKYFSAISWTNFCEIANMFNIWYPAQCKECALLLHKFGSIYYVDVCGSLLPLLLPPASLLLPSLPPPFLQGNVEIFGGLRHQKIVVSPLFISEEIFVSHGIENCEICCPCCVR
jgi:hypothetical protein